MTFQSDLYEEDGTTLIGTLQITSGVQYQSNNSQAGNGSIHVREDDTFAGQLTPRRVVKFKNDADYQAGVVLLPKTIQHAVHGLKWLEFDNQPDLLAGSLSEGMVRPEYGLERTTPKTRVFGPMSGGLGTDWGHSSEWVTPLGLAWNSDIGVRMGYPPAVSRQFKADNPQWIALADPYTSVADRSVNWFRREYVAASELDCLGYATGDDKVTLYVNGGVHISPDAQQGYSWRQSVRIPLRLDIRTHVFCGKVENAPLVVGHTNPVAFILDIVQLDAVGAHSANLFISDTTNWKVFHSGTVTPGWTRAGVIKKLIIDNQALGVLGCLRIASMSFTYTHDSNGDPWADDPDIYEFNIGESLLSVVQQLAEDKLDLWLDPNTMILHAYNRRGSDLSGTVAVNVGRASGTLSTAETVTTPDTATRVLSTLQDATFLETVDTAKEAALGGVLPVAVDYGNTSTRSGAVTQQHQTIREDAGQVTFTCELRAAGGIEPGTTFTVGDTINGIDDTGAAEKYRCIGLTTNRQTQVPTWSVEFAADPT